MDLSSQQNFDALQHEGARASWRSHGPRRRIFLHALVAGAAASGAGHTLAQVDVGRPSRLGKLVPAQMIEEVALEQYQELMEESKTEGTLVAISDPRMQRLLAIQKRLEPYAAPWNARAAQWRWEVILISSEDINAFCMPGGKIAFYTGILEELKLTDDEAAMVMGHEMAHALREHSQEELVKQSAASMGLALGARLFALGNVGSLMAKMGTKLLSLRFSRSDEREADLVGLELAARAGYNPQAAISLWQKMGEATGDDGIGFLSTHPTGPNRIRELERNIPRVQGLYEASRRR